MAVSIDKQKLLDALNILDHARAYPLMMPPEAVYEKGWIKYPNPSGIYEPVARTAGVVECLYVLYAEARVKVEDDTSVFMFFLEPSKGDYANFQGFETRGGTYYAVSRSVGAETSTVLTDQDWKVEHLFRIGHRHDQSKVLFLIDNKLVAEHTTNISAQPYMICAGELKGVEGHAYIKYPYGIRITGA